MSDDLFAVALDGLDGAIERVTGNPGGAPRDTELRQSRLVLELDPGIELGIARAREPGGERDVDGRRVAPFGLHLTMQMVDHGREIVGTLEHLRARGLRHL